VIGRGRGRRGREGGGGRKGSLTRLSGSVRPSNDGGDASNPRSDLYECTHVVCWPYFEGGGIERGERRKEEMGDYQLLRPQRLGATKASSGGLPSG